MINAFLNQVKCIKKHDIVPAKAQKMQGGLGRVTNIDIYTER
jgi:hypothetical protein